MILHDTRQVKEAWATRVSRQCMVASYCLAGVGVGLFALFLIMLVAMAAHAIFQLERDMRSSSDDD